MGSQNRARIAVNPSRSCRKYQVAIFLHGSPRSSLQPRRPLNLPRHGFKQVRESNLTKKLRGNQGRDRPRKPEASGHPGQDHNQAIRGRRRSSIAEDIKNEVPAYLTSTPCLWTQSSSLLLAFIHDWRRSKKPNLQELVLFRIQKHFQLQNLKIERLKASKGQIRRAASSHEVKPSSTEARIPEPRQRSNSPSRFISRGQAFVHKATTPRRPESLNHSQRPQSRLPRREGPGIAKVKTVHAIQKPLDTKVKATDETFKKRLELRGWHQSRVAKSL